MPRATATQRATPNTARSKADILIVDDEASICEILREKLKGAGYRCRTASSADEAQALVEKRAPEAVLCDVRMPGRSGVDLLGWLVERDFDAVTVMVTAVGDLSTAVDCLKAGALDYITKPFNLDQVVLSVERALEIRGLRIENREYREHLETKVEEQTRTIEDLLREAAKIKITDSLVQVTQVLTEMKDLELTLDKVLDAVVHLVSAERGAVFLFQPRTGFRMEANHQVGNRGIQELTRFASTILEGGEAREPFFTADAQASVRLAGDRYVKRNRLTSIACVPLIVGDHLLGALYLDARDRAFDLELYGEDFFRVFGNLAAIAIDNSRVHRDLRTEVEVLKEERGDPKGYEDIIGRSEGIREVFGLVEKLKDTDTTVLILGESGTGKEMVARLIHSLGPRHDKPFIAVNCAALPADLIESELFGIEGGTATGVDARIGKFEAAAGGTIFLDEVGDLPALAQAKILRVLQEKTIEHVGSNQPIEVDVRILAATNTDLREALNRKVFREDLFYRLNVLPVCLPPLRDRSEDIPLLVNHYVERFCRDMKRPLLKVDDGTLESFTQPTWKGNIRELRNAVERAVILSDGEWLAAYEEPKTMGSTGVGPVLDLEKAFIQNMTESEVVVSYAHLAHERLRRMDQTARFLGISFKTLKRRLEENPRLLG